MAKDFMLKMKSGQVIPYTDTCNYLGNTICSHDENVIIDNAITDKNMRLINLLSLYNCTTITGENVNKYDISRDDWNSPINILYYKIDLYRTQHTLIGDICVATSIRELCKSRDSEYTNFFDRNESRKLIDFQCTT